jgi:hypothetical protein
MLTRNTGNAGTNSPIVLVINEDGIDRLQKTFEDTPQDDQEQGQANIYQVEVAGSNITPENLNNSSIHVGIRGNDLWNPEHFVVWGERFTGGEIIPMAIETSLGVGISTDQTEGKLSFPLRRVASGNGKTQINRLLILMTTANHKDAGTDSNLTLKIINSGGTAVVDFDIPDTPQDEQERGQANLYFSPVNTPFTKGHIKEIRLIIGGEDAWEPASFFLFGIDNTSGRPGTLVPLVHIPNWGLSKLSTDSSEGLSFVSLKLI